MKRGRSRFAEATALLLAAALLSPSPASAAQIARAAAAAKIPATGFSLSAAALALPSHGTLSLSANPSAGLALPAPSGFSSAPGVQSAGISAPSAAAAAASSNLMSLQTAPASDSQNAAAVAGSAQISSNRVFSPESVNGGAAAPRGPSKIEPAADAQAPNARGSSLQGRALSLWSNRGASAWPFEFAAANGPLGVDPAIPGRQAPMGPGGLSSEPSPAYYGRDQPAAKRPKSKKVVPTAADGEKARAAMLAVAERGEEVFNAPTWTQKSLHPDLKTAIFALAFIDEALTDLINGQEADVPADIEGDVVDGLMARRKEKFADRQAALEAIGADQGTRDQIEARAALESYHKDGLAAPELETGETPAAKAYRQVLDAALLRGPPMNGDAGRLRRALLQAAAPMTAPVLEQAARLDAIVASSERLGIDGAKTLYESTVKSAKDPAAGSNEPHLAARLAAAAAGALAMSPMLGKQIRPTCTIHVLQSLLASAGVKRTIDDLVAEARRLMADPLVGISTPFTPDMQMVLMKRYGAFRLLGDEMFETVARTGQPVKVSINIGDPVYQHSLILEGFYELRGKFYASLRDTTSYFPTRMEVSDFAKIVVPGSAIGLMKAYPKPKAHRLGGYSKALWVLLGTFLLTQIGVEAMGLAAPILAGKLAGALGAVSWLAALSMGGMTVGSLAGGPLSKKIGAANAYITTLVGRAVLIGTMGALFAAGMLSPWGLITLFALDYTLLGASRTIEDSLPAIALEGDVVRLNRFGMIKGLIEDLMGTAGPILAGLVVLNAGFAPIFLAYPALFLVSTGFALWGLRERGKLEAAAALPPKERVSLKEAGKAILKSASLRSAAVAYAVFYTFNIALYFILGPAFGLYAAGDDAQAATQITSVMTGLNAAGGIAGAWALERISRAVRKAGLAAGDDGRKAAEQRAMRGHMARWSGFGALALLTLLASAWSSPLFVAAGVPIFAAQLLMLPLGFAQTVTLRGMMSLIQAEAPEGGKENVIGWTRFFSLGSAMAAFFLMGGLLSVLSASAVPSLAAMWALNAVVGAAALTAFWASRRMRKTS